MTVILNEAGLVDCSKTCTKEEREKCIHHGAFRRNPRDVGGLGLCFKLINRKTIPNLQYNSEFHYYHSEEGGQE
jgi:hypothetical protein